MAARGLMINVVEKYGCSLSSLCTGNYVFGDFKVLCFMLMQLLGKSLHLYSFSSDLDSVNIFSFYSFLERPSFKCASYWRKNDFVLIKNQGFRVLL